LDERNHRYIAMNVSEPFKMASRYEWGVDTLDGKEIYPEYLEVGRTLKGKSSFVMKIDPRNVGVLLRRKLDYIYPNQRAEVFVSNSEGNEEWKKAGVWYLAGSNTCVYSNPPQELGTTQHIVQTSNRRYRDDEFLLPLALTRGKSAIRIRVVFKPVNRPLFPGNPVPELAWSEIRYTAYSYVPPKKTTPRK